MSRLDREHSIELRHHEDIARLTAQVAHRDTSTVRPLAQEQQHPERSAIDVVDGREIDDPDRTVVLERSLKVFDASKVEPAGDVERRGFEMLGDFDQVPSIELRIEL